MTRLKPLLRARPLKDRVALTWQHHPTATEYRVYKNNTLLATVPTTATDPQATYVDAGLWDGAAGIYHVEAWTSGTRSYVYPGVLARTDTTSVAAITPRRRMLLANRFADLETNLANLGQWDLVLLNPLLGYRLDALRKQHPHITWIAYTNPFYVSTVDRGFNASSSMPQSEMRPDWWLYQPDGVTHFYNADFSSDGSNYWATRVDNPAFVEAWTDWAIRRCQADGFDGIFVDDISRHIPHAGPQTVPTRYATDGTTTEVYEQDVHDALFTIGVRLRQAGLLTMGNITTGWSTATNRLRLQRKFSSHLDFAVREYAATGYDTVGAGNSTSVLAGTEWWWVRDLLVAGTEMGCAQVLQDYVGAGHTARSRVLAAAAYTVGDTQVPGSYMLAGMSDTTVLTPEPWPGGTPQDPVITKDVSWTQRYTWKNAATGATQTAKVLLNLDNSAATLDGVTVPALDAVITGGPSWAPYRKTGLAQIPRQRSLSSAAGAVAPVTQDWPDEWASGKDYPVVSSQTGAATTVTMSAGSLTLVPLRVRSPRSISAISVNVAAAVASAVARLGLYRVTSGDPAELMREFGTLDIATTGAKTLALAAPFDLAPGDYAVGVVSQGAAGQLSGLAATAQVPPFTLPSAVGATVRSCAWQIANVTAALPASGAAGVAASTTVPQIWVREA